ncbi:MAG: sigma 54-interacting transcriptional regulator [Myxococcaceae bacterium]
MSADGPKVMPWTSLVLDRQEHQRGLRGRKGRRVLVIGDLAHGPRVELADRGAQLTLNESHQEAMVTLAEEDFDVVVADLSTCPAALRLVTLLKDGSSEFLRSGFTGARWRESSEVARLNRLLKRELAELSKTPAPRADPAVEPEEQLLKLVGRSAPMRLVFIQVWRMRADDDNVLISGEPGTGRKAIARAIVETSISQAAPFRELRAAQLAAADQVETLKGIVENAGTGTLMIDRVDALSAEAQRYLFEYLSSPRRQRMRIISTTTRDLQALTREGRFLGALIVALGPARIELPPLRDRRDDIVPIAQQVLDDPDLIEKYGRFELKPALIEQLLGYHFPRNVAELVGMTEELASMSTGGQLNEKRLPREVYAEELSTDLEDALFRAFHAAERGWNVPRETIDKAKMRHSLTPFVVLSPDTGTEYAVIISAPELSFVRDPRQMPVVNTVMTIEIAAYLGTAKPIA